MPQNGRDLRLVPGNGDGTLRRPPTYCLNARLLLLFIAVAEGERSAGSTLAESSAWDTVASSAWEWRCWSSIADWRFIGDAGRSQMRKRVVSTGVAAG